MLQITYLQINAVVPLYTCNTIWSKNQVTKYSRFYLKRNFEKILFYNRKYAYVK